MVRQVSCWAFVFLAGCIAGCGESPTAPADDAVSAITGPGHNINGWWCGVHGVPEGICAQCSIEVAEKMKAKGDWCEDHRVPDSQCFTCHPDLAAKFEAQYEAKFGQKPPPRTAAKNPETKNL